LIVAGLAALAAPAQADAQWGFSVGVGGGFYYPWFGFAFQYPYPYPPPAPYPYPYPYAHHIDESVSVRLQVKPKEAEVYVDNYRVGIVDNFDGVFQRLYLPPGDHEITLYREGYHTVRQKVHFVPRQEAKIIYTMTPLGAGEQNEPRPSAPAGPPPGEQEPSGEQYPPRQMPQEPRQAPPPVQAPPQAESSNYGKLAVRVQPSGAEVLIDGQEWRGPNMDERLIVQVTEGSHRVEVKKDGFKTYTTEVNVRRGETTAINVSLSDREQVMR
jgi:hypothetical protein